jgi:uncharacterized membrane protein YkvA (DUF1232 family)
LACDQRAVSRIRHAERPNDFRVALRRIRQHLPLRVQVHAALVAPREIRSVTNVMAMIAAVPSSAVKPIIG